MIEETIGAFEKREISDRINRILRDLGNPEPPLRLEDVRKLLSLDLHYYSSSESGLIDELTHRFKLLTQKTIPDIGRILAEALAKSRLCAFWVPDSAKIMIDSDIHEAKHRWIQAHEITHSVTKWHKDFLLGDNRQTLDPTCHAIIEAEANFGAGRLLFLDDRFASEARDLDLSFNSVKFLAKRYENSLVSTLWRVVEDRDPSQPVFGMISEHPFYPEIGKHDGPMPWKYFIRSATFRTQFSNIPPEKVFELIKFHANRRKSGPILASQDLLLDVTGKDREFQIESFSTTYSLLTLGFTTSPKSIVNPLPWMP